MSNKEIIKNAIIQVNEEMKNTQTELSTFAKLSDEMKPKTIDKFISHFALSMPSVVIAAKDTTLLQTSKEGFVFTDTALYIRKQMKENSPFGKTISPIFYNQIQKIEIDVEDDTYCILTYTDGTTKKAYNSIYNSYIVQLLTAILNALNPVSENTKTSITVVETDLSNDEKENCQVLYNDINHLYQLLEINYQINPNTDIEAIKQCMNEAKSIFQLDYINQAYQLLINGYGHYAYLCNRENRQMPVYSYSTLSTLSYNLAALYENTHDLEILKLSILCMMFIYETGNCDYLDEMVLNIIDYAYAIFKEDTPKAAALLKGADALYEKLVQLDLYTKNATYIEICEKLSNFFLKAISKDDKEAKIENLKKAVFYKNPQAHLLLAKEYASNDPNKAIDLMYQRDLILLTTTIIDEPKGLDTNFDLGCQAYNNSKYIDSFDYFSKAKDFYEDEDVEGANNFNLGIAYLRSIYNYEDYFEACFNFEAAFLRDINRAGFLLTVLYLLGSQDTNLDDEEAYENLDLYQIEEFKGLLYHFYALCFEKGIGVEIDPSEANYYTELRNKYYLNQISKS